jgi:5-methyltetrahydrofolate--homocysteine methyltransferase
MKIETLFAKKIWVLDGPLGTQLLKQGTTGCLELLNVASPEKVAAIHEEYLQAGADIITTNTICADALCLEQYGLQEQSYELARAGAELARRVADKYSTTESPRFVAGAVGPTTRNLTLANDTTAEALAKIYADVVRGLIDGGVDLILVESVMDAANAKVAIEECRKINSEIPIILSAVLSRIAGRVASGATIKKFLEDLPLDDISAVGFNCTNGVKPLVEAVKSLSTLCTKPIVAYPSAGQPIVAANHFAKEMEQMCRAGQLNVIGGCCGTTPEYIRLLVKVAQRWRPRKIEKK